MNVAALRDLLPEPAVLGNPAWHGIAPGKRTLTASLPGRIDAASATAAPAVNVQRRGVAGPPSTIDMAAAFAPHLADRGDAATREIALGGVAGGGTALPHLATIAAAFGPTHDLSHVQAHVGGAAADAASQIGAQAYAVGSHVAFATTPDLYTAAHEAAHVIQQRGGVQLRGGVGEAGDAYERHADGVAEVVVAGGSAAALLASFAGGGGSGAEAVQRQEDDRGLGQPKAVALFAAFEIDLTSTKPDAIAWALVEKANAHLISAGVPPIAKERVHLRAGGGAEFTSNYWSMEVGIDLLAEAMTKGDTAAHTALASLMGSVYHEARHAEQTWLMVTHALATQRKPVEVPEPIMEAAERALKEGQGQAQEALAGREAFVEELIAQEAGSDAVEDRVIEVMHNRNQLHRAVVAAVTAATTAITPLPGQLSTDIPDGDGRCAQVYAAYEQLLAQEAVLAQDVARWMKVEDEFRDAYRAYRNLAAEADAMRTGDKVRDSYLSARELPLPTTTADEVAARWCVLAEKIQTFAQTLAAFVLAPATNPLQEVELGGLEGAPRQTCHQLASQAHAVLTVEGPRIVTKAAGYLTALGIATETSREAI